MKLRPFASITTCYRCGKPIVKAGVSMWTKFGTVSTSSRCLCKECTNRYPKKK